MIKNMVDKNKEIKGKEASTSWMDDISIDSVNKIAEMEILPTLKFEVGKIEKVQLLTEPKLTTFTNKKSGKSDEYFTMEVLKDGVRHQVNCNAKSFRFQLAVLIKKYGIERVFTDKVGITKVNTDLIVNGRNFNNAEVYQLSMIE